MNFEDRYNLVTWPMVNVGGWYDIFLQGTINNFVGIQHNGQTGADGNQKLVIGPYGHGDGGGGFDWPAGGAPAAYASSTAWLNHWIKGMSTGVMDQPPVCYYVLGDVDDLGGPGNEWRFADDWPVPATEVPFYFHEGGVLNTAFPSGSEPPDTYVYDPADPVPNLGGNNLSSPKGPFDQRPIESRDDVILFTTPVLPDYVEITGKVLVTLYASSSAVDTDFTAKLCDVYPDGRSMNVCDGIIKARLRNSMSVEELMVPGTIYEFEIDLWETCIAFNAGHRIRVEISSSNYPRFDANPNTGEPFNQHTYTVPATNTIYHDADHPSRILFRVTGPDSNDDGVADIADIDTDGMPDDFERLIIQFDTEDDIDTIEDVLPDDDFDDDGYTNYEEYLNGTDPTHLTVVPLPHVVIPVAISILFLGMTRQ
jgi:putative CocE/NonD family hydrolase